MLRYAQHDIPDIRLRISVIVPYLGFIFEVLPATINPMKFELTDKDILSISSDAAIFFAFSEKKGKKAQFNLCGTDRVEEKMLDVISNACKMENFTGKTGEQVVILQSEESLSSRVVVIGLGKKEEFTADELRNAGGLFAKKYRKKINSAAVSFPKELTKGAKLASLVQAFSEGLLLGAYTFNKYKKQEELEKVLEIVIMQYKSKEEKDILYNNIKKAELYAQGTILARDLVNEPAYVANPAYLAELAKNIAGKNPKTLSCKVFDKTQCEKMGMEAFLSIARAAGDAISPKFIVLEYNPGKTSKKKVALVGKGITFDSGGINVKPDPHMTDMKCDMAGAAAVLGVFSVISELQPTFPVMGVIAATPNLISATSAVPGDVVKAMNGKTIEILNTDAEGRVTLADSLSYAVKHGATEIIDLATLTGACMVALGDEVSGLFVNNEDLGKRIKSAAQDAGERVWEMPLEKGYKKLNKSDVADIANLSCKRYGGAITAALFLEAFVDDLPWAHLDIAGPAFISSPSDVSLKGGTGFGVRTLLNLLQEK